MLASPLALTLIVSLNASGADSSTTDAPPPRRALPLDLGVFAGGAIALSGQPSAFRFGIEGVYELGAFTDQLNTAVVGSIGYAGYSTTQTESGIVVSTSGFALDLIAALRMRLSITPKLRFYADLGLGLAPNYISASDLFIRATSQTTVLGVFRFAVGGEYAVNQRITIFAEPIGVHLFFGSSSASVWSLLVGARYSL